MRLFHVSENPNIEIFHPIKPYRKDLDQSVGLVWALCERTLPNFITPRDCPRVTYHVHNETLREDEERFFSSKDTSHCVAIEHRWVEKMNNTTLTIYEFDPKNFTLQDEIAGFYVSQKTEKPIAKTTISNLFKALEERNVELKIVPELFTLSNKIQKSSFHWSMCRMNNAKQTNPSII